MFRSFYLLPDPGDIDELDELRQPMGWGAEFPSGSVAIEWNREYFEPDARLDHEHLSLYGSIEDAELATGCLIEIEDTIVGWGGGDDTDELDEDAEDVTHA